MNDIDNKFENLNILVTGGAGFLGSWLCDVLVKLHANVICIDNLSSGLFENINHLIANDNFSFIKHDISTPYLPKCKIDIIFHFASRASPTEFEKYPIQILKANTLGTWVALGITKKYNATLIYASTSEVYGNPDNSNIPTSEIYYGNVNPIGPRSSYDESKRAGEAFAMAYFRQHELDIRILRIFNTYGPRMRLGAPYSRVIPNFITQALRNRDMTIFGEGTQTRSFTYVSDEISGILRSSLVYQCKGQVLNLGNNQETAIRELAQKIRELANSESQIKFYPLPKEDPQRRCPDIHKARTFLNWAPKIDLETGLKKTIAWYKSQKIPSPTKYVP